MNMMGRWGFLSFGVVLLSLFGGCQTAPPVIDTTVGAPPIKAVGDYRGKLFLGIGTRTVDLPEDISEMLAKQNPKTEPAKKDEKKDEKKRQFYGLEITRICAESTADLAGFKLGDVIVSIAGQSWDRKPVQLYQAFGKMGNETNPGDTIEAEILRPVDGKDKKQLMKLKFFLYPYPFTAAETPRSPTNDELRPDLVNVKPAYQTLCEKLVKESGKEKDYQDLLARLEKCEEFPDPLRLAIERYVHRDPYKLETITREIINALACKNRNADDIPFFLKQVKQYLIDFGKKQQAAKKADPVDDQAYKGKDLKAHLDYIEATLKAAAEFHKQAFAALSEEELKLILMNRMEMLNAYIDTRMLSYDSDYDKQKKYLKILGLAKKIDYDALFSQAQTLCRISNSVFTNSLLEAVKKSKKNLDGGSIASRNTPYGRIFIAGKARNRHQGEFAVIYDLGGDDIYCGSNASSYWKDTKCTIPSALIVDFAGDDAYETTEPFSLATGDLGVAFLVDKAGTDSYIGKQFTQGAGFMGIGVLVDEKGDDIYRGLELNQGIGHFGAGILIDSDGNNRFEAHDTSQGVGLPGGCGVLFCGGNGNDTYYCKGNLPSGYGTKGVFEGWGQGMGVGYRPYASGGLGILIDRAGKDYFEAGNFSQGGGYYYAFGILYNGGKDSDKYVGSRYAQGFACHQACGALIEEGGDDLYTTRYSVAQGLSWDEASGLFIDEGGNDRYEGGGFSQGASAMNGFIIFIDRAGKDTYLYTDQARAGGNSYHGGTSTSLFLDLGGQEDVFHKKKMNNAVIFNKEHSYFLDLPGTLDDALKNDKWKSLIKEPVDDKKKTKKK